MLKYFFIILSVFSVFYVGIFLAPYFASLGEFSSIYAIISGIIYNTYSSMCHQLPERSYFIFGYKMTVCARCFGIYSGFLAGLVIYPFLAKFCNFSKLSKWYLILALVPMALDGTSQLIGFRESFNTLRFFTGIIAGFVGVFYIVPVLLDIMAKIDTPDGRMEILAIIKSKNK